MRSISLSIGKSYDYLQDAHFCMTEYISHFLSLSKPVGQQVHEFLITARDEVGVTSKVTESFAQHNIHILSISGNGNPEIQQYVITTFLDFSMADCSPEAISHELRRKFSFVSRIDFVNAAGRLFDSFFFQ